MPHHLIFQERPSPLRAFIGPFLIASLAMSASAAAAPETPAVGDSKLAREILRELIDTRSTHDVGSTDAARKVQARLLAAGFAPSDAQLLIPPGHPKAGNVVARLHGSGKGKPVLYLCHLDVVAANPEDWTRDPFHLTEDGGWLYGRGTIDMKGQDAAVLAALIRMKSEKFVPERDIIVAFTADEESGGELNGVDWLLTAHRALVDAGLVINPDGGEAGMKAGRRLYIGVQTSEKMSMAFEAEVTDKGGHSSRPTDANPIYRLSEGLARLSKFRFPVHLTDTTRQYFERRAAIETGAIKADMLGAAKTPPNPSAIDRLSAVVETNILLRTTCTATQIEGGHAQNALPQRARATLQCRIVPGETQDSVRDTLARVLADPSIKISVITAATPSPESPISGNILPTVEKVAHQLWPDVVILPQMGAGASDSKYTRIVGIASYGIDGMFDDLDDARAHGRDERIGVAAFGQEVDFTYRLMREFSNQR
ncbi:MAG TPA: M20/M25/M40 family metallo-hydrolase [Steroidobacteraceae bacterium]|jgi:acetylornithine deacetylase/succinyl-diaminopimelate desuccinylase-like protein